MGHDARLALRGVHVDRRLADLYVHDDRLVVATEGGEREIPMARLERVATRRSWRGQPRLVLALSEGETLEISRLDASATATAHRTIVDIARRFH